MTEMDGAVRPVVVVGAGLAGLSAALRLPGAVVFDPAPLGGKARSEKPRPDWSFEWGPWSFTHRADPLFELCAELGVTVRPLGAHARYLVVGDRLRKAGPGVLSWGALGELLTGLFRAPRFAAAEEPSQAELQVGGGGLPEGCTVAELTRAAFGPQVLREAVVPMLHGIYAAPPELVEVAAAFPNLAAGLAGASSPYAAFRRMPPSTRASGTYVVEGGIGALTQAMARRLSIEPRVVNTIQSDQAGFRLDTDRGPVLARRVVVATDATDAARLLSDVAPQAAAAAARVQYAPLLVAHWLSRDAAFPRGFGWLCGPGQGVLGTVHAGDMMPERNPPGSRSFATMMGGVSSPDDLSLTPDQVAERIRAVHLRLTGRPVTLDALEVVRHPRAVAIPGRGHLGRIEALHQALPAGLAVAGAWCSSGAMPDAVRAGWAAAGRLAEVSAGGHDVRG